MDVSGQGAVVVINNVRVVMTGCVVLAVQPRLGVQTTSSLHLGTVSGKVTLGVEVAVLPLKMIGCVVLAVLLEPGVPTISSLHLGIVHGVEGTAKRRSRIGVRTIIGMSVKLLALVVGVVATDVLITRVAEVLVAVERAGRRVTMRSAGQTPVVGQIVTSSVFPTITTLKQTSKKKKYPPTTLIQTQPTMLTKRSR